jgi:probable rRNA maturation factor
VDLEIECPPGLRAAAEAAAMASGLKDGHISVELVDAVRIRSLNLQYRGKDEPTDVVSFPVDGAGPAAGPRELGDVVICPEYAEDLEEAVVHGVLHLAGFDHDHDHDHDHDSGEMLALQARVLADLRRS